MITKTILLFKLFYYDCITAGNFSSLIVIRVMAKPCNGNIILKMRHINNPDIAAPFCFVYIR